jgi:hypothetical protein
MRLALTDEVIRGSRNEEEGRRHLAADLSATIDPPTTPQKAIRLRGNTSSKEVRSCACSESWSVYS